MPMKYWPKASGSTEFGVSSASRTVHLSTFLTFCGRSPASCAVVELDALSEPDRPGLGVLTRERPSETRAQLVVAVVIDEPLKERCQPSRVGVEHGGLCVYVLLVG